MSDNSDPGAGDPGASDSGNGGAASEGAAQNPPHIQVHAQYVKDLSFENPGAPQSLANQSTPPKIEVSIDVGAQGLSASQFEVELRITAHASQGEQKAFVVEVLYAGVFTLHNISKENVRQICLIECPRLLFPFARRIVADATRDGGFPPLLLEPIDFAALYQQSVNKSPEAGATSGEDHSGEDHSGEDPSGNSGGNA